MFVRLYSLRGMGLEGLQQQRKRRVCVCVCGFVSQPQRMRRCMRVCVNWLVEFALWISSLVLFWCALASVLQFTIS